MKLILQHLTAAVVLTVASIAPQVVASDIRLEGSGFYDLGTRIRYYEDGVSQGGRYRNLGSDYYHRADIGMDEIYNASSSRTRSGDLSFEFWAMPFFGAESGIVLMTEGIDSLRGKRSYFDVVAENWAISLDEYRYPELNVWEFTRRGWFFRDSLRFKRRAYL